MSYKDSKNLLDNLQLPHSEMLAVSSTAWLRHQRLFIAPMISVFNLFSGHLLVPTRVTALFTRLLYLKKQLLNVNPLILLLFGSL